MPELGDTIGDKVLFSRSITYWDNQINFKGQLIDNYILRDYFTGVLSKRRSWALASAQESVIRHDVIKFYVTASFNHQKAKYEQYDVPYYIAGDYDHIFDFFGSNVGELYKINGIVTSLSGKEGLLPNQNDYIIMQSIINLLGRSFTIDYGFIDNAVAGYTTYRVNDEYTNNTVFYCDSNGEVDKEFIVLCNSISATDTSEDIQDWVDWLEPEGRWDSDQGKILRNSFYGKAKENH